MHNLTIKIVYVSTVYSCVHALKLITNKIKYLFEVLNTKQNGENVRSHQIDAMQ